MIKPITTSSTTTRLKFDETFKREAVANWLSSGKSATVIGEELGISPDRLYAWRKPFGPAVVVDVVPVRLKIKYFCADAIYYSCHFA